MAYSFEMVLVGMILLSAMIAGGITLSIKRRREDLSESVTADFEYDASDNSKNTTNR